MSLILDALRGGRAPQGPPRKSSTAQTDAVLHTLGYGRSSASRLRRITRLAIRLLAGLAMAVAIWAAMLWLTHSHRETEQPAPKPLPRTGLASTGL
jgi:hypothetical protein